MTLSRLRPSVLVAAWTLLVVGIFVVRGELRIADASERAASGASQPRNVPLVVKARTAPRAAAVVQQRGRVFDARGFLVVGAEIVPMERPPLRTDGDGVFAIEMAPGGTADLLVRADGMQPVWRRASDGSPDALFVQLVPAAPWDAPANALASPSPLRGEGVVRDAAGRPLAGAFVTADATGVFARTDELGRFALPLPTPATKLYVHAPDGGEHGMGFTGSAEVVATRTRGAMPLPDVVVGAATGVRGILRDARGQPVAGVPIELHGEGQRRCVESGAGGAFRVGGLAPGAYRVQPAAWRGAVGVVTEVQVGGDAVDLDLRLVAADELRVRVVDERQAALSGVFVATTIAGVRRGIARADADGYVVVPVAAETTFDVRTAEHHAPLAGRSFALTPATLVVARP